MQLLYGNDGINYRTIDKSPEMSEGVERAILSTYSKYEFVSNPHNYTYEPEAITYVTSNLDLQLSSDCLLICKTGRIRKFSSPSYYLHCLVKEIPEDFYEEQFFEIFNASFVNDWDIDKYSNGDIDRYTFTSDVASGISLTDDQLIVILASFMSNESKGQKTMIMVDASGDDYNRRSRAILASIYRYLPTALRKTYGFKTYCRDRSNLPARVSFALFNRDETSDSSGLITLRETPESLHNCVEEKYIEYATYLVKDLDDDGRKQHFDLLKRFEKNGWLSIADCVLYYTKVKKWMNGHQEELLPEWIQYVDQNSFKKGALYEKLLEIIASKVTNEYYNDYLFNKVLILHHESIYQLSATAAKTIRFADCLDNIFILPDAFNEWYRAQLMAKINGVPHSASALKSVYEEEIETLKSIDIMSKNLRELLDCAIQDSSEMVVKCNRKMSEERDEELRNTSQRVAKMDSATIEDFYDNVEKIWNGIRFPDNRDSLVPTIEEWVDFHFPKTFANEKEVETYIQYFSKLNDMINLSKYEDYMRHLSAEKEKLIEEKENKTFLIFDGEVLLTYKSLILFADKGKIQNDDKVKVRIGEEEICMLFSALKWTVEFLLDPQCGRKPDVLVCNLILKNTRIFRIEHLPYILRDNLTDWKLEEIVSYFLEDEHPVKVSGKYIASLIKKNCDPDTIKTFVKMHKEETDGELADFFDELCSNQKDLRKKRKNEEGFDFSEQKTEIIGKLFGRKG